MDVHNISLDNNEADTSDDDHEDIDDPVFCDTAEKKNLTCNSSRRLFFSSNEKLRQEFSTWERPKVPPDTLLYSSSVLQEQPEAFQFFIVDSVSTISSVKHPSVTRELGVQDLPVHNVIRLFGVTTLPKYAEPSSEDDGFVDIEDSQHHETTHSVSVCCNIQGFLSYFYALPIGLGFEDEEDFWKSSELNIFQIFLNGKIKTRILEDISCVEYHEFAANHPCIVRIEVLKASDINDGIYHFFQSKLNGRTDTLFLKIHCSLPRFIWAAESILKSCHFRNWKFECFEANINNNIRFLTDRNISCCSWYELGANKYFLRNSTEYPMTESHCQIEIDVHYENIMKLDDNHFRYRLNPAIRVLSFDIEVMVSPNDFSSPKDGRRQVIQIGNVLGNYYTGADPKKTVIGKTVFVLGTCDCIENAKVVQFYIQETPTATNEQYMEEAEAAMLGAWRDFVIQMDPDIIIGYNIKKFDLPYLIDRSLILTDHKPSKFLPFMGRMQNIKSQIRVIENQLKKVHHYDEKNVNIQGRVILDFYPILLRHDKVNGGRGYFKLSNVAKRYLRKDEEKLDVSYKEIETLQHGNSATRNRIARYCLQDSIIPYLLLFEPVPCRSETVGFIEFYFNKSRIGGTPIRYLLNKSLAYSEYFKQIRLQKNPGRVVYVPDTPSPKKAVSSSSTALNYAPIRQAANCTRRLFSVSKDSTCQLSKGSVGDEEIKATH